MRGWLRGRRRSARPVTTSGRRSTARATDRLRSSAARPQGREVAQPRDARARPATRTGGPSPLTLRRGRRLLRWPAGPRRDGAAVGELDEPGPIPWREADPISARTAIMLRCHRPSGVPSVSMRVASALMSMRTFSTLPHTAELQSPAIPTMSSSGSLTWLVLITGRPRSWPTTPPSAAPSENNGWPSSSRTPSSATSPCGDSAQPVMSAPSAALTTLDRAPRSPA